MSELDANPTEERHPMNVFFEERMVDSRNVMLTLGGVCLAGAEIIPTLYESVRNFALLAAGAEFMRQLLLRAERRSPDSGQG